MTEFIITNNDGMYLYYDNLKKLCRTDRIEKSAKFQTQGKAYNVLNCSFPKKKRGEWVVTEITIDDVKQVDNKSNEKKIENNISVQLCDGIQRYRSDVSACSNNNEKINWNEMRVAFEKAYTDIITYKENIFKQLTDIEAELCDCEHACEFFKFNASKGYKLYSMIRDRRIKRRYLKNEYKKSMAMLNMSYQNIVDGKLERVFKDIDEQSYEPRSLKELFKF